ncbi:MAG: haloacid dehalogenase-like hydrolase [Ruminiclostridium sp.]|nr:haloacid dehalogenase-like hydrolase [Ruminiclostridium sp.]
MKKLRRTITALLAACMLSTSVFGMTVNAGAATSASDSAAEVRPVVTAKTKPNQLIFSWTKVPGAKKYRVFEYYDGKYYKLADTKNRQFFMSGVVPGNKYSVAVRAYVDGKWTKLSKKDICTVRAEAVDANEMLSLWNDSAETKKQLVSYIKSVTKQGSKDYIPVEDRIAVFDFDGTLFCETDPNYFDYTLLAYRVLEDPDYKDKASDFEKEVANKIKEQNETGKSFEGLETDHGKAVASAFRGMTLAEFNDYIQEFKKQPMLSYEGMLRGDGFYEPMIQILNYLAANYFTTYIISGTDRFIVRGIFDDSRLYCPNRCIIGSDELTVATGQDGEDGLTYQFTHSDELVLGGEFIIKNLKMNKVSVIAQEIGEQPVLSFGNSTGDTSMANYTITNNKYKSLAFMLCCDDTERENGNIDKANKMYDLCDENGWIPVSMKNDWKTIYGEGVTYTGAYAASKAANKAAA